MKTTTRYKLCRRLGSSVFEKCQTQKFALSEERKSRKKKSGGGPRSDYGRQLIEKQKVRFTYGLTERQLRNYIEEALAVQSNSVSSLFSLLESRLDNVVYRMGIAPTRRAARQLVSHGHILLNGKRVTIPSALIKKGDKISVREGSRSSSHFAVLPEKLKDYQTPPWLTFDETALLGEKKADPEAGAGELAFDLPLVFQFYSR